MPSSPKNDQWSTLDKDLGRISQIEYATSYVSRPLVAPGIALVFIVVAGLAAAVLFGQSPVNLVVVAAAAFGAYMAI
ncbi:MAG: inorganic phosphate transporter, partial [Thalassovita sp.]